MVDAVRAFFGFDWILDDDDDVVVDGRCDSSGAGSGGWYLPSTKSSMTSIP